MKDLTRLVYKGNVLTFVFLGIIAIAIAAFFVHTTNRIEEVKMEVTESHNNIILQLHATVGRINETYEIKSDTLYDFPTVVNDTTRTK